MRSRRPLLPVDATVVVDELETTPVGIVQVEARRERCVLDRTAYFAAERPSPPEDVLEACTVDIESDLVRVGGSPVPFRGEEDEQRLADPDGAVLAFELVGAGQLHVEA